MKNLIIKVLNARPEEVPSVKLMLYLGFSVGIFLAAYDVAAPTIFLNYFNDETILAQAFLVSGFIGVVATYIYSFLQVRIPYKVLAYGFIFLMLVGASSIWMLSAFGEQSGIIVFMGFVMALPFSYISLLIFWGFFNRVFDLKQAKRIIGGIDSGQLIASIVALFAIAFVLDNHYVRAADLYLLSVVGLAGMFISAIVIVAKTTFVTQQQGKVKERTLPFRQLFTSKYTLLMTGFVLISLICVTFIDYSFLNVINVQWETEAEKGSFLASFEATVVIFSFLFQTFVTDWIIENYGLRTALLINPLLALILAGGAVLVGFLFGYSPGQDIMWFFLAVAASKLFIDSLKDALDGPAFKLYFLPIDTKIKFDVSTKIEGVITALGAVFAGGILILMNELNLSLIYILLGVIPILFFWFILTQRMYGGYRSTLQNALEAGKTSKKEEKEETEGEKDPVEEKDFITNLKLLEKTSPLNFEQRILELSESNRGAIKEFADQKIAKLDLHFEEQSKTPEGVRAIRQLANQAVDSASQGDVISISADRLYNLAKSFSKDERILAAKLLRSLVNDTNIFVLLELLRDPNNEVRQQAIITARKVKKSESWPLLIELLNNKTFTYEASSALIAAGDKVLIVLDNAFHRSGQAQSVMLKIVHIMVEIGGKEAHELLWHKIDFPDRKIVRQILISLSSKGYNPTSKEKIVLNEILIEEIGKALWNITAKEELSEADFNNPLQNALDEEIQSNYEFIYMLLSVIYDPESIELVKENIELGTTEGSAYAIELLDIFLDPEMKPRLFPLLDDISAFEKLDKLQIYYPRQLYEEQETYDYLLNREANNVNRWTKACTLYAIAHNEGIEIDDTIVAHMFNPDPLLAELATWITYKNKPVQYNSVLRRMRSEAEALDRIIQRVENNNPLVFDIVLQLRKMPELEGFNGLLLSQMVSATYTFRLREGEKFSLERHKHELYALQSGSLVTTMDGQTFKNPEDTSFLGAIFSHNEDSKMETVAKKESIIMGLSMNDMFDICTNYPHLIKQFMTSVSHYYSKYEITT
ncbi:MAG: HEAT repeat domain-containing protein [Bacteroidota bacterium]